MLRFFRSHPNVFLTLHFAISRLAELKQSPRLFFNAPHGTYLCIKQNSVKILIMIRYRVLIGTYLCIKQNILILGIGTFFRLNWYIPLHKAELVFIIVALSAGKCLNWYIPLHKAERYDCLGNPAPKSLNWYIPLHKAERLSYIRNEPPNVLIGTYLCIKQNPKAAPCSAQQTNVLIGTYLCIKQNTRSKTSIRSRILS